MLTQLTLQNFRGFRDHSLDLRPMTILVGKNNAGKSTVVEALRLLSLVTDRYPNVQFKPVPSWLTGQVPTYIRGISPNLRRLEFRFESAFHRYEAPPSIITAIYDNGHRVHIYVGPNGEVFSTIRAASGEYIISQHQATHCPLHSISTLPQIGPLTVHERVLNVKYVVESKSSYLASLHFRNELLIHAEYFETFKELSESTWPGLQIGKLTEIGPSGARELDLQIRDNDFVGEVSVMGHGLQMWLQIMWFLARTNNSATAILDEPDVYMHADMQRKLAHVVQDRYKQVLIATHSVEILSEVPATGVLIINRREEKSAFADTIPALQDVIDHLGGMYSITTSRLLMASRWVVLEGDDVDFLKPMYSKLYPATSSVQNQFPPFVTIGGWNGWNNPMAKEMPFKNIEGRPIYTYFIFDRDFHTEKLINQRLEEAKGRGVQMHIWKRKEIENYLIVPTAIQRIIGSSLRFNSVPSVNEIENKIDEIVETLKEDTTSSLLDELQREYRSETPGAVLKRANIAIAEKWLTRESRWSTVTGKDVLSRLSKWTKEEFGVSFSPIRVSELLEADEINSEIKNVLSSIHDGLKFRNA